MTGEAEVRDIFLLDIKINTSLNWHLGVNEQLSLSVAVVAAAAVRVHHES